MSAKRPKGKPRPPGAGRRPVDQQTRDRIVALAQDRRTDGSRWSRNAIARECSVSPSTVSRIVHEELGADFSWAEQAAAVLAVTVHSDDLKSRRARIAEGLLSDVETIRGLLFAEIERKHYSVTLGESTYMAKPTAGEIRDLLIAAGVAIDKHLVLVRADTDERDLPAVDAWLEHMMSRPQQMMLAVTA